MAFYNLSESRVLRVIKSPLRTEEGIAPDTIAVMQPTSYKTKNGKRTWNQEIWVMYCLQGRKSEKVSQRQSALSQRKSAIRIVSAWRYPGQTKVRGELPSEVLREIMQAHTLIE